MPQSDAEGLIETLVAFPFKVVPVSSLLKRGLQIGLAHQLAIYDSIFIALAEQTGAALITADLKQEQAARHEGIVIKAITDFKTGS
jgi:predicted nucleic acid-binding protein